MNLFNNILMMKKVANFPKNLTRFYLKYLLLNPWWLAFFFISLVLARIIVYSLYPFFSEKVISWIENPPAENILGYALPYLILFAGIIAFTHFLWFIRYFFERKIDEKARMKMSEDLQEYVNNQTIGFYAKTEPGKITRNIDYIVNGFYYFVLEGLLSFSVTFGVVIFSAILLLRASILLSIIFIIFNTLAILWTIYSLPKNIYWTNKYADMDSNISGKLNDSLANFVTVKLFTGAKYERRLLNPYRKKLFKIGINSENAESFFWIPSSYILEVSIIFCFGASIYMAMKGLMPVSQVVFCIMTYNMVADIVFDMLMATPNMIKGFSSAKTSYKELIRPIDLIDKENAKTLVVQQGKIEIKNLSFRFSKNYILKNLNLTIEPGQKIGIVGLSGKGKTTLVRLIMRFYDPESGCIMIDGTDIRDVTQESLRANIAFVPQDETMFNRTLMQNIQYGRNTATKSEVYEAARKSNSINFIKKTDRGFNTVVGTRGIKLSGGQRQRISIARAFLKDAPILIMDEATSALDSESENIIQDSLKHLSKNKTTVVIAHRLSTLKHMDKIAVLNKGKIAEYGSHEELIKKKNGIYAGLWAMQSCVSTNENIIC